MTEGSQELERIASSTFVKQDGDVNAVFDSDDTNKMVSEIFILESSERPMVAKRIKLDHVEGKFAWHLPVAGESPRSVLEVVEEARIDHSELPSLMNFVDKLSSLGIAIKFPMKEEDEKGGDES